MKKYILFVFIILSVISLNAQKQKDPIFVQKTFLGHKYFINDLPVSHSEVTNHLLGTPKTHKFLNLSRNKKIIGGTILGLSAFPTLFIIANCHTSMQNTGKLLMDTKSIILSMATTGVIVAGLMCISDGNKQYQRAINIYNTDIQFSKQTTELKFNVGLNYLGLSYRF